MFAVLLDAFLVLNFFWTDAISSMQRNAFLVALVAAWAVLLGYASFLQKIVGEIRESDKNDTAYKKAVVLYLRGEWFETEATIVSALKRNPRDIEMRLLQIGLYRHTKRYDEAIAALEQIDKFDGSSRWFLEIELERRRIAEEMAPI